MVEKGNHEHRRILAHIQAIDNELRPWIARAVYGTNGLPPPSTYIGQDAYRSDSEDEDGGTDFILDATTNARLYKSDVVAATYRFAADIHMALPSDRDGPTLSLEQNKDDNIQESYRYTLSFPSQMMLPSFPGPFCASKWEARREACYIACQNLVRAGIMSYRHFPQSQALVGDVDTEGEPNASQDIKTANTSAQTHGYPRKTPDFWRTSHAPQSPPTTLYPTVIMPDGLGGEPHAPVALLTTAPLPVNPNFALFYNGQRTEVRFVTASPLEVTDAQLHALHGYTVRATRSLTNKPFGCAFGALLCYLAPLRDGWHTAAVPDARWPLPSVAAHIPWDAVQLAADHFAIPLVDHVAPLDERARDAIVLDRQVEFTMRHFVVKVRHDLTPLSKSEDSPVRPVGECRFVLVLTRFSILA